MGQIRVVPLNTKEIEFWWPIVEPHIARAAAESYGFTTVEEVKQAAGAADMQCFAILEGLKSVAACVTEIKIKHDVKSLHVVCLGGHGIDEWLPALLETLEAFKEVAGCDGIMCVGRAGWVRKLQKFGWKQMFTTVGKGYE